MEIFILFYVFVIGLIFGSFFNVVILRPFSNESIVMPPSKCPKCNHQLAWYDKIPVLSYIILRAKCRYCKEPIHWQYPLVEITTAVLFLCTYLKFGFSWQCLFMLIAISFFIIMSATDFKEQVIFNPHVYCFIGMGVIYGIYNAVITKNYFDMPLGILLGVLIMTLLAKLGYLLAKKQSIGEGDTYIAAGIGAFVGAKGIVLTIIFAAFMQVLWALPLLVYKYWKNQKYSEILTMFVFGVIFAGYCYFMTSDYNVLKSDILFLIFFIILVVYAVMVCKDLLKSVQLPGDGIYLPFGPALFIGALIIIFFGPGIYSLLRNVSWLANIV